MPDFFNPTDYTLRPDLPHDASWQQAVELPDGTLARVSYVRYSPADMGHSKSHYGLTVTVDELDATTHEPTGVSVGPIPRSIVTEHLLDDTNSWPLEMALGRDEAIERLKAKKASIAQLATLPLKSFGVVTPDVAPFLPTA